MASTGRKQLDEHRLYLETQTLLEATLNAIPDVIGIQDAHHNIIRYNQAGYEYLNMTYEEVVGKKCYELIGRTTPCSVCATSEVYRTKRPAQVERYIKEVDGWLDIRAYPVLDDNGKVIRVIEHLRDITDKKKAEQALADSEEKFREIFNNSGDAIFLHRLNKDHTPGPFVEVNDAACRKLGYSREALLGADPNLIINADIETDVQKLMDRLVRERHVTFQDSHRAKDGTRIPVEIISHLFELDGRTVVLSIARDIRERLLAEKKLRNNLREKEILLQEIHHRVKNNLAIVSSLLRLQSSEIHDGEDAQIAFENSIHRIRSMAMVHEHLYESENMVDISLERYIKTLVGDLLNSYSLDGSCQVSIDIDDLALDLNQAVPLGLIINELVTNAIKHAFRDSRQPVLGLSIKMISNREAELHVADNGPGLGESFSLDSSNSLGMRLVQVLCDQLQGVIRWENNNGAHFTVQFPLIVAE